MPPDGCLVPTAPLSVVVSEWLSQWNHDRPQTAGRFSSAYGDAVCPIRGVDWLADESGVPEGTIQRIVSQRSRGTELRIADALVQAIDRIDLFNDGDPPTLQIYANPSAPIADRLSCCGGSTTTLNGAGY